MIGQLLLICIKDIICYKFMLSKFKDNLFYLTLEKFCEDDQKKIKHVRNNIKFWDKWLGKDQFDYDFLKETFGDYKNNILLCVNESNYIEGIAVYCNHDNLFFNLILLAKKYNSKFKWLGKSILKELNKILLNNLDEIRFLVLTDVCDIPDYYNKLGFCLTNNDYLRELLDNFDDDLYFIELNSDNFC
jgi:hypothetical protein